MSTSCLCSQILPKLTEVELLKGKAKKVKTRFYYPHTLRSSKTVSEYDSSGKMTSNIDFYIKKNPQKKYFTYDSIGNIVVCIYKRNDSSQRHVYEYKYDEIGRIKTKWNCGMTSFLEAMTVLFIIMIIYRLNIWKDIPIQQCIFIFNT